MGRACARKVRESAARITASASQVEKALELLSDAAILISRHAGVFITLSSDGSRQHRTTKTHCTCEAGVHERTCYHQLAVRLAA